MATQTANYGLTKPASTDFYDIGVFNTNADLIDAALKALSGVVAEIEADMEGIKTGTEVAFKGSVGIGNGAGEVDADSVSSSLSAIKDASNRRYIQIISQAYSEVLSTALQFVEVKGGVGQVYNIYGEHNKPTPAAIGAAAADHTHTAASIGAAAASHTHTLASLGAAPAYTYSTTDPGAGTASSLPEGSLYLVYE